MHPPIVITEPTDLEPTVLQRRILLSFCATVLAGISLCTAYLSGALREPALRGPADLVVMALPDPPAPLADTASSYRAEERTGRGILPLKLEVVATQDAWVEVDTDGHNKYRSLVRIEETLSFEASQRIRMMTGNAPGLELRFNGKPVTTGSKGRVRTLEFTSAGILEVNSRNNEGMKHANYALDTPYSSGGF
jgi:hypothetical protein